MPPELLIAQKGELAIYNVPFDHVNKAARIVLVGITPAQQQMRKCPARTPPAAQPGG